MHYFCVGRFVAAHVIFSPIIAIILITQTFLIEPIRTGDFFKCVDRCLDTFGPRHRDQLDITMHVARGKNSSATRFKVGIVAMLPSSFKRTPKRLKVLFADKKPI